MAFTQNGISYIGTDGADSLVLTAGVGSWAFPTGGPAFIEALGGNDQIAFNGNAELVTLTGGGGNDTILQGTGGVTGQLASSVINGNQGNDLINYFNITNTTLYGGQGNDTIRSLTTGSPVTNNSVINGNLGNDVISASGSITFSEVYGGQGNDAIFVNDGGNAAFNNLINGNKGNDAINVLFGGAGSSGNSVYGGQGDDSINAIATTTSVLLSGDLGNDAISGGIGAGAQTITGGDGRDILVFAGNTNTTMIGGEGSDTFRIGSLNGVPQIEDFTTIDDDIQVNVNLGYRTTMGGLAFSNTLMTAGLTGVLNDFFGSTNQFSRRGITIQVGTTTGGVGTFTGGLLARGSSVVPNVAMTYTWGTVAALLSGQLQNANLFQAANLNQLSAAVRNAGTILGTVTGSATTSLYYAIGFTLDSRRLFGFNGIQQISTMTGMGMTTTFVRFNSVATLAQLGTNVLNGSDIFLV